MKRIVSGITPSGDGSLHIGNYLGAVRQFIEIARDNDCFLFVADMHALTTVQNRRKLEENIQTLILNELALLAGFGPSTSSGLLKNITFYRQSEIGVHGELQSYLNNVTPMGLLKRAHAYKDKLANEVSEEEINLGLFNYPILMAADILLYKPDLVPVGRDQKQHVEITRDIAERFNKTFKVDLFKLPEPLIPEQTAVILGTDGQRKMSKSLGNIISIFDDKELIRSQVNSCFTDPGRKHATDPGHVQGNMVFTYLDFFGDSGRVSEYKAAYLKGEVGDVELKNYLFESLMKFFARAREKYNEYKKHPEQIKQILDDGQKKVRQTAAEMMDQVRSAVGMSRI
ncbi:tryptophan--tRNA ligase [Candidatus Gottesmanbacteria bacterium RBG_16_43_7]|uniref:Tryptophan--tRNA ligase n=1 Tax=Candidatus Gottesmanbacteria bacterium RBG_16_43_7 TaxID=1798373 RepID=A0A1F5Z8S4_9BACT|nr:MAG: tryptophan--tRNA ligase [Candidatus Gottesmanbacteria bacterium RBG_16_43_7]